MQETHVVATQLEQSPTLEMNIDAESESETDDFPVLPSTPLLKSTSESSSLSDSIHNKTVNQTDDLPLQNSNLMKKARDLLNLVGPYLEEMEIDYSGAVAGFLALISDGVSCAIREEEIFLKNLKCIDSMPNSSKYKKSTPPQVQSHEDRRVIVRLNSEHEARKTEPFLLRQQIQRMIPDLSLVADATVVPSGVAILALTLAKAATILQYKEVIARRFGNALVERQESWTTFVIGPLPKFISTMDGPQDPLEGLLLQEPGFASICDEVPIRQMAWTRRSKNSPEPLGHIRIHVLETKANKFPSRLQLFGATVDNHRIREHKPVTTFEKCHEFHSTRTSNMGRGHVSHNLELHLAHENNIDILLVQEPWIFDDLTAKKSLSHPSFQSFSPLSTWDTRLEFLPILEKRILHPSWDSSSAHASPLATDLLQWVSQKNLSLLNPTETPTHRCGGTLDLAFCSQVGATCTIRSDLHTTSDHETLISIIPLAGFNIGGFEGQLRGTAWWNEDCKIAARRYHTARRRGPSDFEKIQLRAAVRRAKKEFWQSKIEKTHCLTDAYRIIKWHNCGPRYQTPLLREPNGTNEYYSPELKAMLFRNTLLSRHLEVEDI
ncbi:hypothetical protein EPUL_000617, partial [Erysiphe pulchra]